MVAALPDVKRWRIDKLTWRLITALVLFSSLITTLITAAELYSEYRTDIAGIDNRLRFIRESYLPTLVESVWVADSVQINTQLEGLSRLQDIEYLAISAEGQKRWSAGKLRSEHRITSDVPLVRQYRGREVSIGTLQVVASVDNVLERLWDKLLVTLLRNLVKTLLVAAFMIYLFQRLAGRHLERIARHLRLLGGDSDSAPELHLERPARSRWHPDALDDVVFAVNAMHHDVRRSHAEILALNAGLERRVVARTRELELAKNAAERASQAKSEFLSRMSHELRTPMNAILGFAQILELENIGAEPVEFATEIRRAGEHLLQLINELLDLSSIDAGKMLTVLQAVPVFRAVNDSVRTVQPLLGHKNITLHNRCREQAAMLADPTRLRQILVNLLSNAVKYNREGGVIEVDCRPVEGERIRLSVRDTGPGIAPEQIANLFTPFERLGAEFSAVEGTGIGLALAKRLTELMGGVMGVDSSPGLGSTFWLELPVAQSSPVPETTEAATTLQSMDRRTVLYVEDNAANLRLVEAIFRRYPNINLLSATNGEYGLELARRYQPSAILLDIHLPGMDGYAVLEELRNDPATRTIPVLALSADAMPIDVERGRKAGFAHYLTKPVKVNQLMAALEAALPVTT